MTNSQAKALAEKVFGEFWGCGFSAGSKGQRYFLVEDEVTQGSGDSWESAFLAAGVEVTTICEDCTVACKARHIDCEWENFCPGLGYRLVGEGK